MEVIENTQTQMRKGILEFCILACLKNDKKYASEIIEVLKSAELLVVEGTLYPILTRLKNAALLDYAWHESELGPPRKYYTLTLQGIETLEKLANYWNTLTQSVLQITQEK